MTDFVAASVWRAYRQCAATMLIVLVGAATAGCETGSSILGGAFVLAFLSLVTHIMMGK